MSNADQEPPPPTAELSSPPAHDPYAALRDGNFRLFMSGSMLSLVGVVMQTFAVSWEIYDRTRSNMALAWVGLVQVAPVLLLFLPAGHLVDRFDRKRILMLGLGLVSASSLGLAVNSAIGGDVRWSYLSLFLVGCARAFMQPSRSALLPQIVPRNIFSNAVTWNSGGFQLAMIAGPSLGGVLIAWLRSATVVYAFNSVMALVCCLLVWRIRSRQFVPSTDPPSLGALAAGLSFVWRTKVILGAITLDMFAVLLGGATALLPVYAKEILFADPARLGWLRAAPGIGAVSMMWLLAHRPPLERAGRALLWSVAGFGIATIVFGLSRNFALSMVMLFALGAFDMISVVVRHTLVQLLTPDAMRGRVSAVNGMFIGISNELGEFESCSVAALFNRESDRGFGPTVSVVSGGIGTLLVVATVALAWPQVRRYGRLDGSPPAS
ncbi:MAG: MFS transporter [Planctomycetaceae bacterium]|nr:MFS transporter [Planctomycetaceae bacterium]